MPIVAVPVAVVPAVVPTVRAVSATTFTGLCHGESADAECENQTAATTPPSSAVPRHERARRRSRTARPALPDKIPNRQQGDKLLAAIRTGGAEVRERINRPALRFDASGRPGCAKPAILRLELRHRLHRRRREAGAPLRLLVQFADFVKQAGDRLVLPAVQIGLL
jgi:hypothetical protein